MKSSILVLLLLTPILFQCKGDRFNQKNQTKKTSKETVQSETKNSCLADYQMRPCDLISVAKISEFSGIAESDMEITAPTEAVLKMKSVQDYLNCKFSWPSDRTMTVEAMGRSMTVPINNSISVGFIKILTEEKLESRRKKSYAHWFEDHHKNVSEEDVKSVEGDVDKKLEEEGHGEEAKDVAKSIMEMASKMTFTSVEGFGDMASYETNPNSSSVTLDVLHGDVIFGTIVDVSEDRDRNLEIAKQISKEILKICK